MHSKSASRESLRRIGKWASSLCCSALFLFCGNGVSFGGVKAISNYYPAKGAVGDVAVTNDGHVIATLSQKKKDEVAGIQIYSPSDYTVSCNNELRPPSVPNDGIKSAFGIALFPDRPHQLSKVSVGLAVEAQGVEFFRIVDLNTCVVDGAANVPQPQPSNASAQAPGTFSVAVTPATPFWGPEFAFAANEYGGVQNSVPSDSSGTVGVVRIQRSFNGGFTQGTKLISPGGYIYIPGAKTLPGVTISRDGRYLYLTHEGSSQGYNNPTGMSHPELVSDSCLNEYPQGNGQTSNGLLSIIDVDKARRGFGQGAIVRIMAAGCSPVRAVESEDGRTIFVATRGGVPCTPVIPVPDTPPEDCIIKSQHGRVLAFDAWKLRSRWQRDANESFIAAMDSGGTAPVGMALLNRGRWLAVANSNRFYIEGKPNVETSKTNVTILDVSRIKAASVMATCESTNKRDFPRGVAIGRNDSTIFVANYGGCGGRNGCDDPVKGTLQVITTSRDQTSSCQ
jgi:hypothetical protein